VKNKVTKLPLHRYGNETYRRYKLSDKLIISVTTGPYAAGLMAFARQARGGSGSLWTRSLTLLGCFEVIRECPARSVNLQMNI